MKILVKTLQWLSLFSRIIVEFSDRVMWFVFLCMFVSCSPCRLSDLLLCIGSTLVSNSTVHALSECLWLVRLAAMSQSLLFHTRLEWFTALMVGTASACLWLITERRLSVTMSAAECCCVGGSMVSVVSVVTAEVVILFLGDTQQSTNIRSPGTRLEKIPINMSSGC